MEHFCVEIAFNDEAPELTLLQGLLENVLFDGVYGDQAVDVNGLGLPDPVGPILGLLVHRWVPVGVVEDHTVGTSQVDSDATAACG